MQLAVLRLRDRLRGPDPAHEPPVQALGPERAPHLLHRTRRSVQVRSPPALLHTACERPYQSYSNQIRILSEFTSVLLERFYDDEYYSNSWYGRVGGVCAKELNILEASLARLLAVCIMKYYEDRSIGQSLQGSFSAVSKPQFASK